MSKIILVFLLVFGLLTSVVSAEYKIDDQRWHWIHSTDKYSFYIDKDSLKYDPSEDCAEFWGLINSPAENRRTLEKGKIYFSENQYAPIEALEYKDNQIVKRSKFNNKKEEIAPMSLLEAIRDALLTLIDRDEQLKEYNDNKEKEEKKSKRDERNENIKNKAINILGGIAGVL